MSSTIIKLGDPLMQESGSQPSSKLSMAATPTINTLAQRLVEFDTLIDALEYAADGATGYNFYDAKGELRSVLSYNTLKHNALSAARRLSGLGLARGDRVALIADTSPEFIELFFACRYAGLVPFAMPIPVNLGSHAIYVRQLRSMLESGQASIAIANVDYFGFIEEAAEGLNIDSLQWIGTPGQLNKLPEVDTVFQPSLPEETAYLQFTSGSTRMPRGVVITEHALMCNLRGIVRNGLKVRATDRCASWLPFYHDMGLVGLVLSPMAAQLSVDYLATRDFAIRPLQWLKLISRNRCTIAFSQPFGLKLCSLRVRESDLKDLDLSCWRAAGIGAEMIRPEILRNFADKFSAAGFDERAFLPCYGLAESTLAVSFSNISQGVMSLRVDTKTLVEKKMAVRVQAEGRKFNEFVNCGRPLPGHTVKIVDENGQELPQMMVGSILVKGGSIMTGYFNNHEETAKTLKPGGWLDTGDIGFILDGDLYITGRRTDVIIVNGRNIRAQDIEELAEQQPEVRSREASAFGISGADDATIVVLVVECRLTSVEERQSLINRLQQMVYMAFGVNCLVELVPPHTLPRTSSGKLSRSAARQGFLQRAKMTDQISVAVHSGDR
ncbi:MAG TPA: fatty acyl-AMP ligase [Nitrosomonas nitrosa]|uniref:Fatty-acyl-CoA synthase n=2 Tax=Nitrosomonas nitrosa TaxID=52442 RepID=A0A8E0RAL5_9PROT|nr:fatty acyl-AMP ligase [Nitrosomonas nitrosa]MCO6434118.1 fatty acyl-AMP ligase [Nitrosomonas nitrosa]CAE6500896.1 Fatty-acyl-CoA synthase [Nitrosomonas nitrosa]HBZ30020.1 fatty acyl-AMP ligase [Nitrosomonas nitrosa]HNP52191.1 fatty acyl-AMP ligase [Nitrosomonas nitrosa]